MCGLLKRLNFMSKKIHDKLDFSLEQLNITSFVNLILVKGFITLNLNVSDFIRSKKFDVFDQIKVHFFRTVWCFSIENL